MESNKMSLKSPLFVRKSIGGMFIVVDESQIQGEIFFVDSNATYGADAAGYGQNPDKPFKTLDYAVGQCTANKGDTIYLMPGHAENLITATSVNLDIAGIRVIGLGNGGLIPTFSMTAAAGSITIAAANILLRHIKPVSNFTSGVTSGLTIAAAGDALTLDDIVMRETSNDKEFLTWVSVATTVDDLTIQNCDLRGIVGGSDVNPIIFAGTSTNCLIKNNFIYGDFSGNVIDHLTGAAVDFVADNNTLVNMDTGAAGYAIAQKSDSNGFCTRNRGFYNKVDAPIYVGAGMVWSQNYANNTLANSDILIPAGVAAVP